MIYYASDTLIVLNCVPMRWSHVEKSSVVFEWTCLSLVCYSPSFHYFFVISTYTNFYGTVMKLTVPSLFVLKTLLWPFSRSSTGSLIWKDQTILPVLWIGLQLHFLLYICTWDGIQILVVEISLLVLCDIVPIFSVLLAYRVYD